MDLDRIKTSLVAKSNQEGFAGAIWFGRALSLYEPIALAAHVIRQRTGSAIAPLDLIDLCRLEVVAELANPNSRHLMPEHVCNALNLYLDSVPCYRDSESRRSNLLIASEKHGYLELILVEAIIDEVRLTSPASADLLKVQIAAKRLSEKEGLAEHNQPADLRAFA
jgi:hypothetical protein